MSLVRTWSTLDTIDTWPVKRDICHELSTWNWVTTGCEADAVCTRRTVHVGSVDSSVNANSTRSRPDANGSLESCTEPDPVWTRPNIADQFNTSYGVRRKSIRRVICWQDKRRHSRNFHWTLSLITMTMSTSVGSWITSKYFLWLQLTSTIRDCTTALFKVTIIYRQFVRKVGASSNSALIRYYLLRLKLSSSIRDHERTNGQLC